VPSAVLQFGIRHPAGRRYTSGNRDKEIYAVSGAINLPSARRAAVARFNIRLLKQAASDWRKKHSVMARECGPPSWVLHMEAKYARRSLFKRSAHVTWVARIRGP
jgi:hypothetical protein